MNVKEAYTILGITQISSEKELKLIYRNKMKQEHPDSGGSSAKAQDLNEAYAYLNKQLPYILSPHLGMDTPVFPKFRENDITYKKIQLSFAAFNSLFYGNTVSALDIESKKKIELTKEKLKFYKLLVEVPLQFTLTYVDGTVYTQTIPEMCSYELNQSLNFTVTLKLPKPLNQLDLIKIETETMQPVSFKCTQTNVRLNFRNEKTNFNLNMSLVYEEKSDD